MEQVKLMCDESIFDCIGSNPRLIFEYARLTQPPLPKDIAAPEKEEIRVDPLVLGEDTEFSSDGGDK